MLNLIVWIKINNKKTYLNMNGIENLFHDCLVNDGYIIEIKGSLVDILNNNFCYIFIINKDL